MGKIVCLSVDYIINTEYSKVIGEPVKYFLGVKAFAKYLNLDDTYVLIFGAYQDKCLETFLETFKGKLLYVSDKCYNAMHDGTPRTTIVVFELLSLKAPYGPDEPPQV